MVWRCGGWAMGYGLGGMASLGLVVRSDGRKGRRERSWGVHIGGRDLRGIVELRTAARGDVMLIEAVGWSEDEGQEWVLFGELGFAVSSGGFGCVADLVGLALIYVGTVELEAKEMESMTGVKGTD
ncbi:hypothetical protein M0R45_035617 [Rubus argutus]|uniref:Uncharacterized protein n=1 Tax=Rubus argutus TaxID=59490 RepID=A0AAW1VY48_RUBAR